jgi:solute carrier family 25 iron transporter 28/37
MGEVEWSGKGSFAKFVVAGAIAGTAEHCGMFPLDTIKVRTRRERKKKSAADSHFFSSSSSFLQTHVQAARPDGKFLSVRQSVAAIQAAHSGGYRGFFRGISAVVGLAAPAHALYFSVYEMAKVKLGVVERSDEHEPVKTALAGVAATTVSDSIMVPMDTIKQRMQMNIKPYASVSDCVRTVLRAEGPFAFYAGYTTTLTMNLPYAGVWFTTYETLCKLLYTPQQRADNHYDLKLHLLGGAGAGVVASGFTNPFDVAKTRLQTQGDVGKRYRGMYDAMLTIWREEGIAGFARGMRPRMMFHATSGAICWGTYEAIVHFLEEQN